MGNPYYTPKKSYVPEYARYHRQSKNPRKVGPRDPFAHLRARIASECIALESGCIEWQGAQWENGYAPIGALGRQMGVHRAVYMMHNGDIPEGMEVDHMCRNRLCVNVGHLQIVTRAENIALRDMRSASLRKPCECPCTC